ncbi:hematopoietic lineage cell-specific protein-like, partial [Onychomys torridus]|uniref:hematopoietic lineage cell-specific protein-like n=1 Tax=Onychomys torridus TaxID=38674 RepID=UPI00167F2F3C
ISTFRGRGLLTSLYEGSLRCVVTCSIHQLRSKVSEEHDILKKKELEPGPKASHGYGGRFGVERDRMDKSAVGHEYVADVKKHSSQTDASRGFGGKYGVERDRADKSAVGFDYKGEVEKHASQKGKYPAPWPPGWPAQLVMAPSLQLPTVWATFHFQLDRQPGLVGQGPLYDYQGEGSDELSFDPDDIITDIEMVDEGWWRGRCHGHFGLFPANYVKLL